MEYALFIYVLEVFFNFFFFQYSLTENHKQKPLITEAITIDICRCQDLPRSQGSSNDPINFLHYLLNLAVFSLLIAEVNLNKHLTVRYAYHIHSNVVT